MAPLPANLKKSVEDAFHNNELLSEISAADREVAAFWYEAFAEETVGSRAELARLYNLERAAFLRGQVVRIARNAPEYAREIDW